MPNFNRVILLGRLTAKPELRYSQAGKAWTRMRMAVNDNYKTREGEVVERVTFVDVSAFEKQAETLSRFLDKGEPLLVEGRLNQDSWEDKEGNKRSKIDVTLQRFQFIGSRRETHLDEAA